MKATQLGHMSELVIVLEETERRMSQEMRGVIGGYVIMANEVLEAEARWRYERAPDTEEPLLVKQLVDELRLALELEPLIPGTDGNHQFFRRAIHAALALATIRLVMFETNGRMYGDVRDTSSENRTMKNAFESARRGFAPPVEIGASLQDARAIGIDGGSWAAFILDGRGA